MRGFVGVLIGNFANMYESTFSMLVIQGEKHEWKEIVKTNSLQFHDMLHEVLQVNIRTL